MTYSIQEKKPERDYTGTKYNTYGAYKPYLRENFNKRCGYCDGLDVYAGGSQGFQIDHFKPKKLFPDLETEYENLVYSCPYCNRSKWDYWRDDKGFIDPCSDLYSETLYRNDKGQIKYYDGCEQGEYIHQKLKLDLRRHELIWIIEKLKKQSDDLDALSDSLGEDHPEELTILREFKNVQKEIKKYTNLFYDEI
ncbi:HNH endonuclease [Sulfurimonas sp.]|uniref:HNH endonuclease n=1 Tax=Sulfurimonas sp. TaxID=2022749 RepID=UPI003569D041